MGNVKIKTDEHARRILQAVYGDGDDDDRIDAVDDATVAQLQAEVDAMFEHAWANAHARSRAELEARRARPRRALDSWSRPELVAHLAMLQARHGGQLQLAHRKLESLSDDDLRSLVSDLEAALDREDRP